MTNRHRCFPCSRIRYPLPTPDAPQIHAFPRIAETKERNAKEEGDAIAELKRA